MIELLAPIGLAALGALIVPILIHLVRRSERRLVDFAALRWLEERNRPRKQIRLHERVLLALRLSLIAILAAVLALPVLRVADQAPVPAWVVVASGVDIATARAAAQVPSAEWHWLAPGFPSVEDAAPAAAASLASLIRELDAALPEKAELTLIVPERLSSLDASRLALTHAVHWQIVPGAASPADVLAQAAAAPFAISVRHDDAGAAELPVTRAFAKAWEVSGLPNRLDIATADVPIPDDAGVVFWLAGKPADALVKWIDGGGTAILSRGEGKDGSVLIADETRGDVPVLREQKQGRGRLLEFAAPLTTDAIPALREAGFPERLRRVIAPAASVRSDARAKDFEPSRSGRRKPAPAQPLDAWLALIAALLFLAERWLATGPRRGAE